ncbi:molybdenum cofactor guanylyltransferase MobA [Aquabacterium sp.]|uniref:molybdenum cofactor guanylyltransferase MobA n=1 Tax=Aquabacterium sp. TaxID=1872578 RepID=UPI0025B8EEC4|nr:molybdenum cofactor guanylyltransferase MobA [Aquabacterium sp.]
MAEAASADVTGWLLAGGEGRRMQGQDKGLVDYQGRPLAAWVLSSLAPQCQTLRISANRNLDRYAQLLLQASGGHLDAPQNAVVPDDPDLEPRSGPLAGLITAMRHTDTEWLMVAPCDMPHLPHDLVARLMQQAVQTNADIVIPCTESGTPEPHHHWVCGLIRKRVCPDTLHQFVNGERKVGHWVRSQSWSSVSFNDTSAFANMNSLETLRGRD